MFYFLLACDLLIPLTMLIGGWLMWRRPPREINALFGYRTTRSMKNQDTWQFAHKHCGRLWWRVGFVLLVLSILAHVPFVRAEEDTLGMVSIVIMAVQLATLIGSIIPTERALKRTFHEDGTRK